MRIVAGRWKGHPLVAPKGKLTRPTSDRVREALFNILGDIDAFVILDLFSGTGAVALEALSRGAGSAVCVERNHAALRAIRTNAERLGANHQLTVAAQDVNNYLASDRSSYSLIFADPPWAEARVFAEEWGETLVQLLLPDGCLVLERGRRDAPPPELPTLEGPQLRIYGDTALVFYRKRA